MDWLRENWFWIVVAVLFIWMHARMHGGHGGRGGCGGQGGHGGHGGCGGHDEGSAREPPDPHDGSRTRARTRGGY